jgi:hypothetical protein
VGLDGDRNRVFYSFRSLFTYLIETYHRVLPTPYSLLATHYMPTKLEYEETLARYSDRSEAVQLLKKHRPYLEMLPSMRRSEISVMSIPLPVVKLRQLKSSHEITFGPPLTLPPKNVMLPCDLVYLMCDPEWKIKMGGEIFIFIHRPDEDFSDLLARWRETQVILDRDYEWVMPQYYQHIISEGTEKIYPLFVLLPDTNIHIRQGLSGSYLPWADIELSSSDATESMSSIADN